jgi:hypothetical protein
MVVPLIQQNISISADTLRQHLNMAMVFMASHLVAMAMVSMATLLIQEITPTTVDASERTATVAMVSTVWLLAVQVMAFMVLPLAGRAAVSTGRSLIWKITSTTPATL